MTTTKENLAVGYISKAQAIEHLKLNFPLSDGADNSKERYRYMQALADLQAIRELPSVTPQPRKGQWTEEFNDLEGEVRFTCSSCGKYQLFGTDFCYNCGSDNREVEE